ncbi:hypothetical protein VQ042_23915 [Aurantimonas sp. A2-1-M11]|uniref:hypothetical protein n=1 Tax=Aurantimonas sp. A2-1-M11 TaxID=3113712 RepID=UPI002F942E2E
MSQEDLAEYLTTAAARNASLIKSLGDDAIKRVEQATYQAILQEARRRRNCGSG